MKFGGASVSSTAQFAQIADIIIEKHQEFPRLVVVVSAMGKTTDSLISLAREVNPNPPQREYDMLLSTGERISMSLLAMALCRKGKEALSFTGSQSGIITCGRHAEAKIIDVRPFRIEEALEKNKIVIVAGFQGVSMQKEITTLGRGGSDTTAVALALALKADLVEYYKDVPAICDFDPNTHINAKPFDKLTYKEALQIIDQGAKVLHARAVLLAEKNRLKLHVRSFVPSLKGKFGTVISDPSADRSSIPCYE